MKNILIAVLMVITLSVSVTSCSTGHSSCKGLKAHPDYRNNFSRR